MTKSQSTPRPADFYGLYKTARDFKKPRIKQLTLDELVALPPDRQLAYVQRIRVSHSKFTHLMDECLAKLNYSGKLDAPGGLLIMGPSRSGKTTLIEQIAERYPVRVSRTKDDIIPVLVVTTPPYPDAVTLMEQCLYALGDPLWYSGTRKMKRDRLYFLLDKCRVKVVFLDETQHLVDMTGDATERGAAIFLQQLVEDINIAFVFLGLERSVNLFRGNSALRGRFEAPLHFTQYDWEQEEDRKAWTEYLEAFVSQLPFRNLPDFSSPRLARKMWYASFGLCGLNSKLLWKCTDLALRHAGDKETLTMEILEAAFDRTAWGEETGLKNPFVAGSRAEERKLPPIVEDYHEALEKKHETKMLRAHMVALTTALKKQAA